MRIWQVVPFFFHQQYDLLRFRFFRWFSGHIYSKTKGNYESKIVSSHQDIGDPYIFVNLEKLPALETGRLVAMSEHTHTHSCLRQVLTNFLWISGFFVCFVSIWVGSNWGDPNSGFLWNFPDSEPMTIWWILSDPTQKMCQGIFIKFHGQKGGCPDVLLDSRWFKSSTKPPGSIQVCESVTPWCSSVLFMFAVRFAQNGGVLLDILARNRKSYSCLLPFRLQPCSSAACVRRILSVPWPVKVSEKRSNNGDCLNYYEDNTGNISLSWKGLKWLWEFGLYIHGIW